MYRNNVASILNVCINMAFFFGYWRKFKPEILKSSSMLKLLDYSRYSRKWEINEANISKISVILFFFSFQENGNFLLWPYCKCNKVWWSLCVERIFCVHEVNWRKMFYSGFEKKFENYLRNYLIINIFVFYSEENETKNKSTATDTKNYTDEISSVCSS